MKNTTANELFEDELEGGSQNAIIALTMIIFVVGIVGNAISGFVILVLKEYKKSTLHLYVLQLVIADTLFLCTIPFKVEETLKNQWIHPLWLCVIRQLIIYLNYSASVIFLMVMSFDRYIAVCHTYSIYCKKLREPLASTIIIILVWLISFLVCIPIIKYSTVSGFKPNCKCKPQFPVVQESADSNDLIEDCIDLGSDFSSGFPDDIYDANYTNSGESYKDIYTLASTDNIISPNCHYIGYTSLWYNFLYVNFTLLFILPVLVMVITYGFIIRRLREANIRTKNRKFSSTSTRNNTTRNYKSQSKSISKNKRVTFMCVLLVSSFIIFWLPFHIVHLKKITGIITPPGKDYICDQLLEAVRLLGFLNSALNPYFYNFIGTNFFRRLRTAKKTVKRSVRSSSSIQAKAIYAKEKKSESGNVTFMTRPTAIKKTESSENSELRAMKK